MMSLRQSAKLACERVNAQPQGVIGVGHHEGGFGDVESLSSQALIDAINSRGRSPIEGVTCVELDIAPPPEEGDVGYEGLAPRLRMVARGGRFLLVMVEGDAWLFPTIETLDRFKEAQIDASIFKAQPDSIDRPQLILPAMLREVGGLWEVTDPGKLLVPAR